MSAKVKYPRADALKVARQLCVSLADVSERLIVAGSLRRRKEFVGDVEILYIPNFVTVPDGLFDSRELNLMDVALEEMLKAGIIAKRKNVNGSEMWGAKNKLAVHVASGIPVDMFAATAENWFNYLVCRTGSAENNLAIAIAAQAKGWKWNPYGSGFSRMSGLGSEIHVVTSEREVFEFVGLPYKEPWER